MNFHKKKKCCWSFFDKKEHVQKSSGKTHPVTEETNAHIPSHFICPKKKSRTKQEKKNIGSCYVSSVK